MKEIDRLFNDFYNVENDRFDLFSKIYKSHGTTSNFLNALFNHDCGARWHRPRHPTSEFVISFGSQKMAKPIPVKCYLSTFRNEGIEIRRFQYKDIHDPSVNQLKEHVKGLYPQLRGEKFELMYLG